MWGGNHLLSRDGRYYVFDPAVYYGHREADIALTSLFGGFSAEFYRGYGESYPLAHGWEYRQGIYQAYHLLNHHNMMGGSYARQAYELLSS
jgi:fructosamine-3-kinase